MQEAQKPKRVNRVFGIVFLAIGLVLFIWPIVALFIPDLRHAMVRDHWPTMMGASLVWLVFGAMNLWN